VSTDQTCAGDGRIADAATADHRDGVVAGHRPGVDRCADAGHHSAAQQAGYRGIGLRIDLGALTLMHQGLFGERPDTQCRGEFGAVGKGHLLRGIESGEAVPGAPAPAGPALTAHGPPVQDHEVAEGHVGDTLAHRLHGAGRLMSEQERVVVVDPALPVGQVGVAHPACLDRDDHFAGSRIRDDDVDQFDR
jgi:hypothetical protein